MAEPKRLEDYREPAGEEAVERLAEAAAPLKGKRMIHVSSTAFGGGVAELLYTHIALLQDLGIEAEWQLIDGSDEFFNVTKLVHNALQGMAVPWTESFEEIYLERVRANAERWESEADFVFIHDPQPLAMLTFLEESAPRHGKWIWRCHIDLSQPMEQVWSFLAVHAANYDAAVFTLDDYVRPGLGPRIAVIPPSIDPLSPKNSYLDEDAVTKILTPYGIDRDRPLLTQVSRFDPWKDPLGVIDAYRIVKRHIPEVQLAMVGSMAHDDPEAWHFLEMAEEHRAGDPDVHLLTNVQGAVGPIEVNAFQRASDVVIQKSIREGFGLTASEGMWKKRPLIAGRAGGLRLQVKEGVTGYLVDSPDQCAGRILELLRDEPLRRQMGEAGYELVRERFLSVRELTEYLELLGSL
jgi:trehalose synthase